MIDLEGGRFWMGSRDDDQRAYDDEHPRRRIEVAPFSLSETQVTQRLYREIAGRDPGAPRGDALPVNRVSWLDAITFCNALSAAESLPPAYRIEGYAVTWIEGAGGYRLPTEAEWEYAARAGTTTTYACGDDDSRLGSFAWFGDHVRNVMPVGRKKPNAWGLHDMHGNVWEWCWDVYGPYGDRELPVRPRGRGSERVVRGGSFGKSAWYLRSAVRSRSVPAARSRHIGFRCARGEGSGMGQLAAPWG
jgi:formylglycine-generating enzyme required for sulfatase activity